MATYAKEERRSMGFEWDKRDVDELRDIKLEEEDFSGISLDKVYRFPLVPLVDEQDAYELGTSLCTLQYTLDEFYEQIFRGKVDWDREYPKLDHLRERLITQLTFNSQGTTDNYKYTEGVDEHHYRFDIVIFQTLLECVACLQEHPDSLGTLATMFPKTNFPLLCKDNIVPRGLQSIPPSEFNVSDMVSAMKTLEFRWCFIEHSEQLLYYLDSILARFSFIYKNPHDRAFYNNITDYMEPVDEGLYIPSRRMLEDFCWAFRPMYQKLAMRPRLSSVVVKGRLSNQAMRKMQELASINAREMNNKTLTDVYQKMYARYIIRPSEIERYHRDKPGHYAEAIRIMKYNRSKDSVNQVLEKMSAAPWDIVNPQKPLFDPVSLDIMYLLLIDTMANNLWNLQFMNTFVILNLDLIADPDLPARLNVLHPLIVQDFNHFNLLNEGKLFIHNSVAKSFIHWLQIFQKPPHNGYYEGLRIDPVKFNAVANFEGETPK